jgi:hypothetical protein
MKRFFILAACSVLLFACSDEKKDEPKSATDSTMSSTTDKDKKPQPSEFADPKYAEWGKKMSAQLSSGDIDGWLSNYADNAKFRWSSGDSLSGKAEISKYWTDRRKNVIDSISFTNDIWLPLKVNIPQTAYDAPGVWLLSWYMVNVKYKNGKKLVFWAHIDHHYDANDKIDQTIQYIDMAPIKAALAKK